VEKNPLADVPMAKVISGEPGILTPEQMARLLESADEATLPFWAIGGFAGLRTAELARLQWEQVDFQAGLIEVTAKSSKTAARRLVKIEPNLLNGCHRTCSARAVCPPGL
jgi:integrase